MCKQSFRSLFSHAAMTRIFVEVQGTDNAADCCTTCRLITIYDCKVVLHWKGRTADGTEATGKLTIPEVSHEITLDGISDYVVCASVFHLL
jgi:activator of HSP90 ATPase